MGRGHNFLYQNFRQDAKKESLNDFYFLLGSDWRGALAAADAAGYQLREREINYLRQEQVAQELAKLRKLCNQSLKIKKADVLKHHSNYRQHPFVGALNNLPNQFTHTPPVLAEALFANTSGNGVNGLEILKTMNPVQREEFLFNQRLPLEIRQNLQLKPNLLSSLYRVLSDSIDYQLYPQLIQQLQPEQVNKMMFYGAYSSKSVMHFMLSPDQAICGYTPPLMTAEKKPQRFCEHCRKSVSTSAANDYFNRRLKNLLSNNFVPLEPIIKTNQLHKYQLNDVRQKIVNSFAVNNRLYNALQQQINKLLAFYPQADRQSYLEKNYQFNLWDYTISCDLSKAGK